MRPNYIDHNDARKNVLACAAFLAERITSNDAHADSIKEIVDRYIARGEVDLAAQLADAVEDFLPRDRMLRSIALYCAEHNDDEYALQLADAIEDPIDREVALENIACEKARQKDFEKAEEIAASLPFREGADMKIAVYRAIYGDDEAADAALAAMSPALRAQAYSNIAKFRLADENLDEKPDVIAAYLTKAEAAAAEVDMPEEKLREMAEIAGIWIQTGRKDRAIEILSTARGTAETVESREWREYWLMQIAHMFFQADSRDLAEHTLDLIQDKYFFALTLKRFAEMKRPAGGAGGVDEALEDLEEAYALIASQKSSEIRDSKARFELFTALAADIAACGKPERAMEIAALIEFDDARNRAYQSIAVVCAAQDNEAASAQALRAIEEDGFKTEALIAISDVHAKKTDAETALKFLREAHPLTEEMPQLSMRSGALQKIAQRYHALGENARASAIMLEDLGVTAGILDEFQRVCCLAEASDVYGTLELPIGEDEKAALGKMITRV